MLLSSGAQTITHFLWCYAAVTSVVTTKLLLLDQNFTYPTFLLLIAICGHVFIVLGQQFWNGNKPGRTTADTIENDTFDWICIRKVVIWQCAHITVTSLTLFLGYQALLHLPSFSTALMLLTFPLPTGDQEAAKSRLRWLILIVCGAVIVFSDYRLIPNGVLLALGSRACGAFARWLESPEVQNENSERTVLLLRRLRSTTPVLQVLLIGFIWSKLEMGDMQRLSRAFGLLSLQQRAILALNTAASGYTLWYSGSMFYRIQEPPRTKPHADFVNPQELYKGRASLAYSMVCVALTIYTILGKSAVLSLWQYLAFLIACGAFKSNCKRNDYALDEGCVDVDKVSLLPLAEVPLTKSYNDTRDTVAETMLDLELHHNAVFSKSRRVDRWRGIWLMGTLFGSIFVMGWSAWWTVDGMLHTTPPSSNAVLDTDYVSIRGLDIVISRYDESIDDLIHITQRIRQLPSVAPLLPRLVVYNKNNGTTDDAFYDELYDRLPNGIELSMHSAPNVGREGETYLRYVADNWDDLPAHTLFMQGSVHNEMEFLRRIKDYFVPNTGFLSLGFAEQTCNSCDQCNDRHGWLEQPSVLRDISTLAHGGTGCRDIVLTYKGQFIASSARIRGVKLENWRLLQEHFNKPDSPVHTLPYLQSWNTAGRNDTLDAPVFGFTMERMWGVMMQCSEMHIAERCPSLYAGLFSRSVNVGDCQCLDL